MRPLFITGIGTNIGKTVVAAILVEKLHADYWKPIQSGDLEQSDTLTVKNLITNKESVFHPEAYQLTQPFSPHKSADLDHVVIDPLKFKLPKTNKPLIIEGAGGLMVPLNNNFLMIDLIKQLETDVILVSKNYLGSINHTLLSVEALKFRQIPIKGIVFNGETDRYTESVIKEYTGLDILGHLPDLTPVNQTSIREAGKFIKPLMA